MQSLTHDELQRLLHVSGPRLHCMITVAWRHGMRASEACNLKWDDVDFRNRTIKVRRLKGSLTTIQPMSQEVYAELKDWSKNAIGSPYVFPGRRMGLSRRTFFWDFQRACKRAEIPLERSHPHVLKHSLGRALAQANVTMPVIKQALGHVSINSTAIYTQIDDETTGRIVLNALKGQGDAAKHAI